MEGVMCCGGSGCLPSPRLLGEGAAGESHPCCGAGLALPNPSPWAPGFPLWVDPYHQLWRRGVGGSSFWDVVLPLSTYPWHYGVYNTVLSSRDSWVVSLLVNTPALTTE